MTKNFEVALYMEIFIKGESCLYWKVDMEDEWDAFLSEDEGTILTFIKQLVDANCSEDEDVCTIDDYGVVYHLVGKYAFQGYGSATDVACYGRTRQ